MAQNTALQELIEYMKNHSMTHTGAFRKATELLPKERQDIEQAHDKGISRYCQWEPDRHGNEAPTGSDYFIQTFTQNK